MPSHDDPPASRVDLTGSIIEEYVVSDGERLRYRHWKAGLPSRGTIVALHGIQSHSGWYGFTSRSLAAAGWDVCFLDRRGSGLNESHRGFTPHADRLVNDVLQFVAAHQQERSPGDVRPLVLLGLSWGGRLAACLAARRPELFSGLVLLYPGLCARIRPTVWQRGLLRLAESWDVLKKTAPIPLSDPALFTSDPGWQKFIAADPLALRVGTAGLFTAGLQLENEANAAAGSISVPILVMLAGRDEIIDNGRTMGWFEQLGSNAATLIQFPEARHTLEFEACRDESIRQLIHWLDGEFPL